jgi:hypothetical protein
VEFERVQYYARWVFAVSLTLTLVVLLTVCWIANPVLGLIATLAAFVCVSAAFAFP